MANPQAENGHVDIANEIVEALARTRISGEEMQVLMVIFRKTYGWHKKEDAISLGQFSEMTGLSRIHVLRAIKKLLPKMVIRVTKNGNTNINVYEFNKDYETWKVLPKKVTVTKNGNKGVTKNGNGVLPKKVHTKETIQKKTNKRNNTLPVKQFIDLYFNSFKDKFGTPPIIHGPKEGNIVKSLLLRISFEELSTLLERFFDSTDPFITKSGYTLSIFTTQINKLKIGELQEVPKHMKGLKQTWDRIRQEESNGRKEVPLLDLKTCVSIPK